MSDRQNTLLIATLTGAIIGIGAVWFAFNNQPVLSRRPSKERDVAYANLVGNTPLVKLEVLSKLLGSDIFVKMESMNPGGTGKDRAASFMLQSAKSHPRYREGVDVVEGTSGSTGIALATMCRAQGLKLHVVMPDDQAEEKRILLERLGANVVTVPSCGIANKEHYVNHARRLADELDGIFLDQFENLANFQAHYMCTGPEIWQQCDGKIDAFVMSSGTGGTLAGVSRFLKERRASVRTVLADPLGSSLCNRVLYGVCFTDQQRERGIRKHRYDSIVEGVGLDRITKNFDQALIDDAEKVMDQEVLNMAHWLLHHEGLFVGSSSALNVVAACRTAKKLGPGCAVVTVICDSGHRHLSRLWNPKYIQSESTQAAYGTLVWPSEDLDLSWL